MRQPLFIFPFGATALEALSCVSDEYELIGFIDDDPLKQLTQNDFGIPVYSREVLTKYPLSKVLAVPANPISFRDRQNIIEGLGIQSERYVSFVHPQASISPFVKIGENCLIMAGVVITANVVIGDHCIILPNTVIHHDVTIRNYTFVGSNVCIAGGTMIEKSCWIGSGSNLIQNITIGSYTMIGMGSNVLKSYTSGYNTIAGNPARIISTDS